MTTLNKILVLVLLLIVGYFTYSYLGNNKLPTPEELEPKLRAFLIEEKGQKCEGEYSIDQLYDISIGEYVDRYDGWQVFARYQTTCLTTESNYSYPVTSSQTYNGLDGPDKNVSVAFLRKKGSGYELFTPAIFKQPLQVN